MSLVSPGSRLCAHGCLVALMGVSDISDICSGVFCVHGAGRCTFSESLSLSILHVRIDIDHWSTEDDSPCCPVYMHVKSFAFIETGFRVMSRVSQLKPIFQLYQPNLREKCMRQCCNSWNLQNHMAGADRNGRFHLATSAASTGLNRTLSTSQ